MKKIIDWWFDKQLAWRKSKLLHEIRRDIEFLETRKSEFLTTNVQALRNRMADERKKEKPDGDRIASLSVEISTSEAVKAEFEKLKRLERELPEYIDLL